MILEHLLKKSEFMKYVESLKIPDHMLKQLATPIEWKEVSYLKECVEKATKLSAMCRENNYARKEKRKLAYRTLSYLCRNNYSCDDVFDSLYSRKNPESKEKATKSKERYRKEIVLRHQYIWALKEISSQQHTLGRLFDSLEQSAEYPERASSNNDFSKVRHTINFLHETEEYKDKLPTGKMSFIDLVIHYREMYLAELDNSLDDAAILAFWLSERYELLSNTNLKRVGELLCDAYQTEYESEIAEYRSEKKKTRDRNRYTPNKRLSAHEKREEVKHLKASGYTQKQTADALQISRSTVERYWNR